MLNYASLYTVKTKAKDPDQSQGTFYNCVLHVPVQLFTHSAEADIFRGAHVTGCAINVHG